MNYLTNMLERRKSAKKIGNAGFTLVELIIVIAILAALVAILAPQYTKYIEKSRVSADKAAAEEFLTSANVAIADGNYAISAGDSIVFTATGTTITGAGLVTAVNEYLGLGSGGFVTAALNANYKTTSKNVGSPMTYTITVTSNGTAPNITYGATMVKTDRP